MKKKTYKAIMNRLYRETKARMIAEGKIALAEDKANRSEEKAERFRRRFRNLGNNVKTTDPGDGKYVRMMKWEIKPEPWGEYMVFTREMFQNMTTDELYRYCINKLARQITEGLLQEEMIQFIVHDPDAFNGNETGILAAKLYVVPWEQMPHKKTIVIKQYVDDVLEGGL